MPAPPPLPVRRQRFGHRDSSRHEVVEAQLGDAGKCHCHTALPCEVQCSGIGLPVSPQRPPTVASLQSVSQPISRRRVLCLLREAYSVGRTPWAFLQEGASLGAGRDPHLPRPLVSASRAVVSKSEGVKGGCLRRKDEPGAGDEIRTRDSLLGRQELFH